MPSPTSSTRPTSRASSFERYCSISLWSTETISSALNLMTASHQDVVADVFQLGADRAVVLPIADADAHAADQLGLDLQIEDRLPVQRFTEFSLQALLLIVGQGHGRGDLDPDAPGALIMQLAQRRQDRPQQLQTLVVIEHQQKIGEYLACVAFERPADD